MISRQEIVERAGELSLRPEVVEKDYVLGWMLAGIANHAVIGGTWAFKGGTCLKKVHFETYRFSEDLDFTLSDARQLDENFLRSVFEEIAVWTYERTGIEIPSANLRFDVYSNKRGNPAAEGRVYYRGPLTPRGSPPAIRLDLTADERIVHEPVLAAVDHPYSDAPPDGIRVRSYSFTEVFAEKIRALGDRGSPRDLYDVINLFRQDEARRGSAWHGTASVSSIPGKTTSFSASRSAFPASSVSAFAASRMYRKNARSWWSVIATAPSPLARHAATNSRAYSLRSPSVSARLPLQLRSRGVWTWKSHFLKWAPLSMSFSGWTAT